MSPPVSDPGQRAAPSRTATSVRRRHHRRQGWEPGHRYLSLDLLWFRARARGGQCAVSAIGWPRDPSSSYYARAKPAGPRPRGP